jgi:hypothetical protein
MLTCVSKTAGVFQGDQDFMFVTGLSREIMQGNESEMAAQIASVLRAAPIGVQEYYDFEYNFAAGGHVTASHIRAKFDNAGSGEKLLKKCLAEVKTGDDTVGYFTKTDCNYRPVILAALMMQVGATIKDEELQRLQQLVPAVKSSEHFVNPLMGDDGFRGPGKRQFLAALDHYKSGTPRSFVEPSCHACGKIKKDIGRDLLKCGGCQNQIAAAWFCDKVRIYRDICIIWKLTHNLYRNARRACGVCTSKAIVAAPTDADWVYSRDMEILALEF